MTPTVIFDGNCGFCRRWIARWQRRTGNRVVFRPYQESGLLAMLGIPLSDAHRAMQLVDSDGTRYQGADAVFRALEKAPGRHLLPRLAHVRGVRWIVGRVYDLIARHRVLASRIERMVRRPRAA